MNVPKLVSERESKRRRKMSDTQKKAARNLSKQNLPLPLSLHLSFFVSLLLVYGASDSFSCAPPLIFLAHFFFWGGEKKSGAGGKERTTGEKETKRGKYKKGKSYG